MNTEKFRANTFRADRLTLLFVDDEAHIVESLTQLFDKEYNIYALTNPLDVLELLKCDRNVCIVVSDQRMPEMRGVDLLRKIGELAPATLRILLTGYADLEAVLDSVNVGEVYRYLRKPWKPETIRSTIGLAAATYLLRTPKRGMLSPPVEADPLQMPSETVAPPQKKFASFEEEFFASMQPNDETQLSAPTNPPVSTESPSDDANPNEADNRILGRSGKPKVLLIDDEEQVLSSVSELLSQDYDIIGCKSPATALDIIHANPFIAVVISDQRMPQMSGVDFLIEAQRLAPEIPKILMTGQIDAEDVIRLVNEGQVYRYISKPWNIVKLKETLRSAVEVCKMRLQEKTAKEPRAQETPRDAAPEKNQPQVQLQNLRDLSVLFQKKTLTRSTMPFIHDNFLLQTKAAETLYHEFAEHEPIIDYHCHLPPDDIAQNKRFETITQIWLYGDHYKWRAMRTNGIDERFCTGEASDWEKFEAWANTVPKTLRNPLYHWTHLELARYFNISDRLLNGETAKSIWNDCNAQLADLTTQRILKKMNVRVVCTTDDPVDSLEHHVSLSKQAQFPVKVLPTFRPDKILFIENAESWNAYLDKLSAASNRHIASYDDAIAALRNRRDFFAERGCRLFDCGIETMFAEDFTETEVKLVFEKARSGKPVTKEEALKYKSAVMIELGVMNHEKKWTQQFHIGALRNNNSRMMRALGADAGFDSIGDLEIAAPLAKYLNRLDDQNKLANTILYNLNPRDNEVFATMIGNFQDGASAGKVQYGSAWWFLDQKDGMEKQMNALSNMGLLSRFVGMVTDSRSFLSYPRHEYFRRTLCNLLGAEMENGLLPNDMTLVGEMTRDICRRNAERYFGFFND